MAGRESVGVSFGIESDWIGIARRGLDVRSIESVIVDLVSMLAGCGYYFSILSLVILIKIGLFFSKNK